MMSKQNEIKKLLLRNAMTFKRFENDDIYTHYTRP